MTIANYVTHYVRHAINMVVSLVQEIEFYLKNSLVILLKILYVMISLLGVQVNIVIYYF